MARTPNSKWILKYVVSTISPTFKPLGDLPSTVANMLKAAPRVLPTSAYAMLDSGSYPLPLAPKRPEESPLDVFPFAS